MKIIDNVILGKIDMKKQTTLIRTLLAVPLILASASNARADGTHGCKIRVQNNYTKTDQTVLVFIYNGKDAVCELTHNNYKLASGDSVTAKTHAQGSSKCTLGVSTGEAKNWNELCLNLPEGSRCAGGEHTIRVAKKGSLMIHEDGSCTKSE